MDETVSRLFESPADFGDWLAEYRALVEGCALALRADRRLVRLSGPRSAEMLNGLVTNSVTGLESAGRHALLLTAKGRVSTDLRVFPFGDGLLLDVPEQGLANLMAAFKKYLPPIHATYEDVSQSLTLLGVYGPDARRSVADALAAVPEGHLDLLETQLEGIPIVVVRARRLAGDGVELVAPRQTAGMLVERLLAGVLDAGGRLVGSKAVEVVRVECGIPRYGFDMSEENLAQETGLENDAISYDKGCYLGQEVVARVHFRGHVNRRLGGLRFDGGLPAAGTRLSAEAGKEVGLVTSAVESPDFGAIALGYVRRELEVGDRLSWDDAGREGTARVADLPFRDSSV